jgi:Icc protein
VKHNQLTRRQFIGLAGISTLGIASACSSRSTQPTETTIPTIQTQPSDNAIIGNSRKRVLRIAHLTDFHVQPEGMAAEGMAKALRHVQSQADPAEVIFNTGDCIMDSLEADKQRTEEQWSTWNQILAAECKLPIYHAIGNHDVWGWGLKDSQIKADPLYGKAMAIEKLGLKDRYYRFERAGWCFLVLDSTHTTDGPAKYPYIGKVDDEQFSWLTKEVEATPETTPICILSHIPILSVAELFDGPNEESGNWVVPAAWMHIDARRFRQYFLKHPNIRLCLSGHSHQHEAVHYLDVDYHSGGAVCGNWWFGAYMDFPPAYVLVDLYDDGNSESQFVAY